MPALGIDAPQPLDEGIAADDAERIVIVPEGEVLQTRHERSTATIFDLPIRGVNVQADHGLVVESAERRSGYGDEPGAIQRPPHEPRKVQAARNPKGKARRQFEQTADRKGVVSGKSASEGVDVGGGRILYKNNTLTQDIRTN